MDIEYLNSKIYEFDELIKDQFTYGGKKYSLSETKESTDILFDRYGKNWLLGTLNKYVFRYQNVARGRDLFKIACYSYLIWLKRGYHIDGNKGTKKVIDTTIDIKESNYNTFINEKNKYVLTEDSKRDIMHTLDVILSCSSMIDWLAITQEKLYKIYQLCFYMWLANHANEEIQDKDTYNDNTV